MAFCIQCGRELESSMRFCPYCGTAQQSAQVNGLLQGNVAQQYQKSDYRVILLNLGTCSRADARGLMEDLLGYSASDALRIVNNIPVEAACCLNEQQACTLAQALTEYGLQVAVCDADDAVDLSDRTVGNVFSENGTLLASAIAVLATLGLVNRVSRIRRWERPGLLERVFTPRVSRPVPPPIRHHIHPVYTRPVHIPRQRPDVGRGPSSSGGMGMNRGPGRPSGDFRHFGGPDSRGSGGSSFGGRAPGGRGPGGAGFGGRGPGGAGFGGRGPGGRGPGR